ncbi:hypothetical protein E2C01_036845 [Portunus trituberculatus]|uniref:Uncharacterized protein n=1 Tax=Portunus trituberculatus TaxID=210409 RepID=A0A5B7FCH3_PORTR|nr:hypothetical protein [Portunus trituberculatus]
MKHSNSSLNIKSPSTSHVLYTLFKIEGKVVWLIKLTGRQGRAGGRGVDPCPATATTRAPSVTHLTKPCPLFVIRQRFVNFVSGWNDEEEDVTSARYKHSLSNTDWPLLNSAPPAREVRLCRVGRLINDVEKYGKVIRHGVDRRLSGIK